jgi:multiple sugar transport system ATP-binding protein
LEVEDGEFVSLVGPSGCGKSTLLRIIAGLENQTAGHVYIDRKAVDDIEPKDRDIAMVFQNYALYPHMSVRENIAFSLRLRRESNQNIERKIREASEILSLGDVLDRYPAALSGGQRQRVAMGRAIVRDPKVFLFDEPLSNLDAQLRVQMRGEIKSLHRRLGATTIYVTHDQIEAMTMSDKIVVLKRGVIEQVGAPLELYDRPANTFVATFIGSPAMNLIEGRAHQDGFHTVDGHSLPMGSSHNGAMTYGVRPEHIRIDPNGVQLSIEIVEPNGAETYVSGSLGRQRLNCLFRERVKVNPGDMLPVAVDVTAIHMFGQDGHRII